MRRRGCAVGYDLGMTEVRPKQKVSLSLDADLVAAFDRDGPLSTQVNEALRSEWQRRRRAEALSELLDAIDRQDGPLDSADDEAAIQRYTDLLA